MQVLIWFYSLEKICRLFNRKTLTKNKCRLYFFIIIFIFANKFDRSRHTELWDVHFHASNLMPHDVLINVPSLHSYISEREVFKCFFCNLKEGYGTRPKKCFDSISGRRFAVGRKFKRLGGETCQCAENRITSRPEIQCGVCSLPNAPQRTPTYNYDGGKYLAREA